ncbi:MAG: hypothetical protein SOT10_03605 [Oscillospiraceae bacterium]|nr:hypothetical protein [uncultured Ruminococcus sp.]MDY2861676.1 hypothetical protein [Oscillospiraceae bacterium]
MGEKYYWVLGFCCGFIAVVIVTLIIANIKRKKNTYTEYDERQVLARGKAYKSAFFVLIGYIIACALVNVLEINWAELSVQMFIGLFLSTAVFVGISIFNDAYFTSNKGRKSLLGVLAFIAGAEYLGIAFGNKTFVTNGIANLDIIPIIAMIWAISIFVMVVIKTIIDKKAVEE